MLLILVIALFIFMTVFYHTREGMDVMDKTTIVATDTNIQIPNHVSGTRGEDITFGGNINVEKNDYLELGKGLAKGDNAGKIRYQGDHLEIFGAGKKGDPYNVKLWHNVEVGGLLQTNSLQFGKDQGKIQYDTNARNLNIMGPGTEGQRKVKIWDDVEVGKLLSTNGMEVRGPFQAYNDMNISGSLNAGKIHSARISVGDLDISGNINNMGLNTRLSQLDKSIQEHGAYIAKNPDLMALQTRVTSLNDKLNSTPAPVDINVFNQVQSQVTSLNDKLKNTPAPVDANVFKQVQSQVTSLNDKINNCTPSPVDANVFNQVQSQVTLLNDKIKNTPAPVDANVFKQVQSQVSQLSIDASNNRNMLVHRPEFNTGVEKAKNDLKNDILKTTASTVDAAKSELKSDILKTVTASLEATKTNTDTQMASMLKTLSANVNKDTSTKTMSDASLNLMFAKYDLSLQNISSQAKSAMDKAEQNAPDQDWVKHKNKLLQFANLEPAKLNAMANLDIGKLNALSSANLDLNKMNALANLDVGKMNALANLDVAKMNAAANLDVGKMNALANLDVNKLNALANLNASKLSGWANSAKTYTELQDSMNELSGKINGYEANKTSMAATLAAFNTSVNNMNTTLLGIPNTYVATNWANTNLATKTDLNAAINGMNASYIPKTDANKYVTETWANTNLATKTDLNSRINGLNASYIPLSDGPFIAKKTDLTAAINSLNASYIPKTDETNLAKKTDLTNAISSLNASYVPRSETNNFAKFDSNNNLSVPGNLLVGNVNKWKLDPLAGSLQVTKQ